MRASATFLLSVALAAVVPALSAQSLDALPATAATTPLAPPAPLVAGDTTLRLRFDIPAGPLAQALEDFARQAAVQLRLEGAVDPTIEAPPVVGVYTAAQALRILLAGSGYQARFADAQTVVVRAPETRRGSVQTLDRVVVTAAAARPTRYTARRTLTATKTDVPLRDVPQAVTVVDRELVADQAMQSMADVVRYIPGITMGQGEGHRDAPTIRGNASTADFFVDGVRDDAQYLRDLYNVERVEALKGSNAMIFGRGGGGGVLNRVSKEAQWALTRSLTFEGGSFDHRRATIDVGQGLGYGLAARLNGMYEHSGVFRDATSLEREGLNPTVAILAGGALMRLGYEYFADRRTVDRGIPSFEGRPSGADVATYFGDPELSRARTVVHGAAATIERDMGRGVMLRNRSRFMQYDKFYKNVFPGAMNAAGTEVSLSAYDNTHDRRNLFNQTDVTFAIRTGPVRQTILVGAELGHQLTDNYRETGYFNDTAATLAVPFERPTVSAPVTFRQSASDANNRVTAGVAAAYVQDQVELGSHWQAVGGVRYDHFALRFRNHRNAQVLRRHDRMVSPRAGLVFKPVEPVSIYGAYSLSYLPSSGDQFASLSATTSTLEPERFTNRELGLKWELRPDLALTAALYRVERTNTSAPDPADPARTVQTGRQRTTGVEAGLAGNVTSRWQIAGGWAVQRATILSRTSAAAAGATVPLVPHHTLSLWNRYQATRWLGAGLGVVHQADMYAAIDNTVTLPGFTRLDGAAFVSVGRSVRLQMNVENLLDRTYYPTSHGNNNIMPGATRTVRVSVTARP